MSVIEGFHCIQYHEQYYYYYYYHSFIHLVPPTVLSNGPNSVVAVTNLSLTVSFTVYNDSPPIQQPLWTFTDTNGYLYQIDPFNNSDHYIFSNSLLSLTILSIEYSDEGNYSILVTNNAGSSTDSITVDVQSKTLFINIWCCYYCGLYYDSSSSN